FRVSEARFTGKRGTRATFWRRRRRRWAKASGGAAVSQQQCARKEGTGGCGPELYSCRTLPRHRSADSRRRTGGICCLAHSMMGNKYNQPTAVSARPPGLGSERTLARLWDDPDALLREYSARPDPRTRERLA